MKIERSGPVISHQCVGSCLGMSKGAVATALAARAQDRRACKNLDIIESGNCWQNPNFAFPDAHQTPSTLLFNPPDVRL